jgi:hypothetical protein
MSFVRRHIKVITVAASCALVGAGASAIATAGASSSATTSSTTAQNAGAPAHPRAAARRAFRHAVHGSLVVPAAHGSFASVTFDRGFVESVGGQQLTLKEGTRSATYKTITLTIPSDAVVRDNHQASSLTALRSGQHVAVIQGPNHTWVIARDG